MAHQAGVYPGFCSMKRLGVFLLSPGWDASPSQGYLTALNSPVHIHIHLGGERYCESFNSILSVFIALCSWARHIAQEHNVITLPPLGPSGYRASSITTVDYDGRILRGSAFLDGS